MTPSGRSRRTDDPRRHPLGTACFFFNAHWYTAMLCPTCRKNKPETEFYLHWTPPRRSCKDCVKKAGRRQRLQRAERSNPEHAEAIRLHRAKQARPEGHKWCERCCSFKPLVEFSESSLKRGGWCRECYNVYSVQRVMTLKGRAIDFLGGACSRCGFRGHPAAFDFHHHDPHGKEMSWGDSLRKKSWKGMQEELKKCRLLCRCCHSIIHSRFNLDGSPNSEYVPVNPSKTDRRCVVPG